MEDANLSAFGLVATKLAMEVLKLSEFDAFVNEVVFLDRSLFERLVDYKPRITEDQFFWINCQTMWEFKGAELDKVKGAELDKVKGVELDKVQGDCFNTEKLAAALRNLK